MFRSLSLKAVRRVVGEEALKANGVTLPLPINEVLFGLTLRHIPLPHTMNQN